MRRLRAAGSAIYLLKEWPQVYAQPVIAIRHSNYLSFTINNYWICTSLTQKSVSAAILNIKELQVK
jgi:hypothetical protein